MVEGERVPGEAAVRQKRCRDPIEAAATIGPRGQMQQRPAGAVDQGRRLLEFKLPYVSFTQVELDSLLNRAHSSLREHRRRRVNPYYTPARCLSNRDRNAPGANCKLDQWPVSITGKPDVERDVSSDASGRPVPVSVRQGVVPARHGNTNLRADKAAFGWASVPECPPSAEWDDLVLDLCLSVPLQVSKCGSHGLELLGRMTDPVNELANDAHRLAAAEGLRRIPRKLLVGQVRVVLELSGGLDDVDAPAALTAGELGAPDRGVERCCEVDVVHDPARFEVRFAPRNQQIAHREVGLRAVQDTPAS